MTKRKQRKKQKLIADFNKVEECLKENNASEFEKLFLATLAFQAFNPMDK